MQALIEHDSISDEFVDDEKMQEGMDPYLYLQSWISACQHIKFNFRAPTYVDGSARPQFRGVLHLLIFFTIITTALPYLLVRIFSGNLEGRWWKLVFFFLAKGSQYGSSMYYHIFPHNNIQDSCRAAQIDYFTIPVSGFSNSILIFQTFGEIFIVGTFYIIFILITGLAIHLQFKYPKQGRYYKDLRIILNSLQFLLMLAHNGIYAGFRDLWFVAYVSYIISFGAFFLTRDPILPWHKAGIYGSHEDFHFFLLIADLIVLLRGFLFLENPSTMNNPSTNFFRWSEWFFWDECRFWCPKYNDRE